MKTVNLIITGGIAASKSKILYDILKDKYNVNLILTKNSKKFVKFAPNTKNLYDTLFDQEWYDPHHTANHVYLNDNSQSLTLIYPATYNFIGKISNGIADDIASVFFAANNSTTYVYPSMNSKMYENPILKLNKDKLLNNPKLTWFEPKIGLLASRIRGIGRALEPDEVASHVDDYFSKYTNLWNKKIVLAFGKTRAWIDDVRYITNNSSGKMGLELLNTLETITNNLYVIYGDIDFKISNSKYTKVSTNQEMLDNMKDKFKCSDIVINLAALNDYEPNVKVAGKIEKNNGGLKSIELSTSVDVLKELGKIKEKQFLVGFSLQNELDIEKAKSKLKNKNLDMIVLNKLDSMNSNKSKIVIINGFGKVIEETDYLEKKEISKIIILNISNLYNKN